MNWSDDATELFAELVAFLPSCLRPSVEERAETQAEAIAFERGLDEVKPDLAFFALMECTPQHMRGRLLEALDCRNAVRAGE